MNGFEIRRASRWSDAAPRRFARRVWGLVTAIKAPSFALAYRLTHDPTKPRISPKDAFLRAYRRLPDSIRTGPSRAGCS